MKLLSSYVLREFILYLFFCMLAFVAIFILVDTVENIDDFVDSSLHPKYISLYYGFYLPYIIVLTLPVAMLIATMFSLGRFVGDNEITAMKASGISLYRILMPLYLFSLFVGVVTMVFSELVVPSANLFREDIKNQARIMGRDPKATISFSFSKNREMDRGNVFLANGDGRIVNARIYHSKQKQAVKVYILEPLDTAAGSFSGDSGTFDGFRSRIDADSLTFSNGMWYLHNVTERIFDNDGEIRNNYIVMPASFITLEPSDFARIDKEPEEMNFFELSHYIRQVKASGGDASEWLVDLYMKISFPFVSFVIVFFGAPLAASSTRRGKTASFGIALTICFVYYMLINAFQILGRNGTVNPVAAAWLPNASFFVVGLNMHLRAKK